MMEVLIVVEDPAVRDALSKGLGMYATCFVAQSLEEVQRLPSLPRDLALLDVSLGPNKPSGVAVHHWLNEQRFAGRIVYLTGQEQSWPLVQRLANLPRVKVLTKPVSVEQLKSLV